METPITTLLNAKVLNEKIDNLLAQKIITVKDVESLSMLEREHLEELATGMLVKLVGQKRDDFLEKIEQIVSPDTKNSIWEHNHTAISSAVSNFIRLKGMMPSKNAIARQTGLSRQTVAKHLEAYKQHPEFIAEMEQFQFMSHKVMASVFRFAANGDMRAAKLYFELIGAINKQPVNTVVTEQNNYLQINNTILSQESLKQLSAEQLDQIENIVTRQQKVIA